jgi:hypothetical protein
MSTILLLSLSGSPGVTTASVALTMTWPRSTLLIEADTSRYSAVMPGYLRAAVPHTRELGELAVTSSAVGSLDINQLWSQTLDLAGETEGTIDRRLLPGFSNPVAATAMDQLWGQLAAAAASLESGGYDVLIDAGRWMPNDRRAALLDNVDMIVVIIRPTLPDVIAAYKPVEQMRARLAATGRESRVLIVLAQPPSGSRMTSGEIHKALGVAPIGTIAWDPRTAVVFSEGERLSKRVEATPFGRSLASVATGIRHHLEQLQHDRFDPTTSGTETTK